jgi:hemerythrin superfamily protein
MDAITLLKQDHVKVKSLLREFEAYKGSEEPKRRIAEQIVRELMAHETIEEQVFYPAFKEAAKREDEKEDVELVAESKQEHRVVDLLLDELQALDLDDEDFDAKMKVLQENVEHHIQEEEEKMFPAAKKLLTPAKLDELGDVMQELKTSLLRQAKSPPPRDQARREERAR